MTTHAPLNSSVTPTQISCCDNGNAIASDPAGNLWVSNYGSSSVSEISPANTVLINQASGGGLASPSALVIDANGNLFVPNYHGASLSVIAGSLGAKTPASAISPAPGYGRDLSLIQPFATAVDASGNVWMTDRGANKIVMFFGLAAPTRTPMTAFPAVP
ncbi:hypothetical protein ACFQBQ_11740 [Granulicella cerasi]|uniref:NHL repeat containing protein n=2 Tax=Granulicella cerasi TaxID=741063 RepID=A0ABW1ZBL8_9BACT